MVRNAANLLVLTSLLFSCRQNNDAQIAAAIKSVNNSNTVIADYTETLYAYFDRLHIDSVYMGSVYKTWYPKTQKVRQITKPVLALTDNLIKSSTENPQLAIAANELFAKLFIYKRELASAMDTDNYASTPAAQQYFNKRKQQLFSEMPVLVSISDTSSSAMEIARNRWLDSTFENASPLIQQLLLQKIKNDVLISEQMLLKFCYQSFSDDRPYYH